MAQKRFQERWKNINKSRIKKIYICYLSSNTNLTFLFSYFLSSSGTDSILSKKELIVQNLSSEPKPTTKKFAREKPTEFVVYNYQVILLENIKKACSQCFNEKRN